MNGHSTCCDGGQGHRGSLRAPERNRYYFGKLLDAYHLELEQAYANDKRWLVNRLSAGAGVLCGLRVETAGDGTKIRLSPGVALDGLGREIIVPTFSIPIDPRQPTDACGKPEGDPLVRGGVVGVYLCYHECPRDPAPVLVDACGAEELCEYGIVQERYRIGIRAGAARPVPDLVPDGACARIFAQQPKKTLSHVDDMTAAFRSSSWGNFLEGVNALRERRGEEIIPDPGDTEGRALLFTRERAIAQRSSTRRALLCSLFGGACVEPGDPCIPIATVRIDERGRVVSIDNCAVRRVIYSNAFLLDLILCLAERVDACCDEPAVQALSIVSGNNQSGVADELLDQPLVVRVTSSGGPVKNEPVTFDALGDGEVGKDAASLGPSFTVKTKTDGTAALPAWKLGAAPGLHLTTARIADGLPHMVTFRATAERRLSELPVIAAVWPPNGTLLARAGGMVDEWYMQFARWPRIQLTFSRAMRDAQLSDPDPWLGVFAFRQLGDETVGVVRMGLAHDPGPHPSLVGAPGQTETFEFLFKGSEATAAAGRTISTITQPTVSGDAPALDISGGAGGGAGAFGGALGDPGAIDIGAVEAAPAVVPTVFSSTVNVPPALLRMAVIVRSAADAIVAAGSGAQLDGEFAGTALTDAQVDELLAMGVATSKQLDGSVWGSLIPASGAVLPSGDGNPGGTFHSTFGLAPNR